MKRLTAILCLTLALLLGSVGTSWSAAELKPLSSILLEESSDTMTIYGIERCAALFLGNATLLETRGKKYQAVAVKLKNVATDLTILSSTLSKKYGFERPMEVIQRRIVGILKLYVERWAHNSSATGHNIGPLTQSDMRTCKKILATMKK